jgi:hypothetical protein
MLMTTTEALASLRARRARKVPEQILAAFSLWRIAQAGGTAEVLCVGQLPRRVPGG